MASIRIPVQKRSIEKRDNIIKKGFELMCNKGYYNISTPDIAKEANVSTGIIYQYFNDKKDIFMEGVKQYSNNIMFPMLNTLYENKITKENLESILTNVIEKFIKNHTISKKAHEELLAMSHLDEDVASIFKENEIQITKKVVTILEENNFNIPNLNEKVHIIIGMVDNLCHEIVYHKHKNINYDIMKKEVITAICSILE